jgi:oxygen-dependent protoporphyrinogen oxidase
MGRESTQRPLGTLPKGKGGKGTKGQLELVFESNGMLNFAFKGELLSWLGKICKGIGALIGHAPQLEDKEETIHEWVTHTFDGEVFLCCIDPFVLDVYMGNPEALSMKVAFPKLYLLKK